MTVLPGPIPNRSENLSRDRDANRGDRPDVKRGELRPATRPDPDPDWHHIAKMVYDSFSESGQADFFQTSDWAMAYHTCEELSVYKNGGYFKELADGTEVWIPKRNGQILTAINTALTELLVTEGARRRMRIELSEPEEVDEATVTVMDGYREALAKKGKKK